jgi:hypothetical protein
MQATRERPLHMQAPDLAPTIETAVRIQREFEEVIRMHETNNSQSVVSLCALLRTFDGNLLRHEHEALRGSTCLRGGDAELELALIKLIDDLAHGCLIQID